MFFRLIRTDFKRITHYGFFMIAAAFVTLAILLSLALKSDDLLYSDSHKEPLSIGIAMNAGSTLANMAYRTVADMDSYSSSCVFTEFSDKTAAISELESGQLFAVIYVPDNIISDIMNGTNTPVEVYYSDMHSIDTFVLNDLFRSTASMLGISQAAIYSVQAIGREMNFPSDIQSVLSDDINALFLRMVLGRSTIFAVKEINAVRSASTTDFYVCAAIILMMLICSAVFIPFIIDIPASYKSKLKSFHMGCICRNLSSVISIFVWEYILYIFVYLCLSVISLVSDDIQIRLCVPGLVTGLIIAAFTSAFVILICLVPAGIHGCTLLLTVTAIAMAYLSGFFIPETMLPNFAKDVCDISILNKLVHTLCSHITG